MKIDIKNGIPIYLQINEQIKLSVLCGRYRSGDRLPSVRELAVELRINPNTVVRAYQMLKDEGIIDSRPGGGNFVLPQENKDMISQSEDIIVKELQAVINKADMFNVARERINKLFQKILSQGKEKAAENSSSVTAN